jgi:uncharacterized membrane protein (DUF485 family)
MMQQAHHHMTGRDWDRLANDPEYKELLGRRRRFVIPATLCCLIAYLALPISIALAPNTMRAAVLGPLTGAVIFAIALVAFSLSLLVLYLIKADKFDARAEKIAEHAHEEFSQ